MRSGISEAKVINRDIVNPVVHSKQELICPYFHTVVHFTRVALIGIKVQYLFFCVMVKISVLFHGSQSGFFNTVAFPAVKHNQAGVLLHKFRFPYILFGAGLPYNAVGIIPDRAVNNRLAALAVSTVCNAGYQRNG